MHDPIANCGCVHHAEEGIPCIHDQQLKAIAAFKAVLANSPYTGTHTRTREEVIAVQDAGWKEIPSEGWHFVHHNFPTVMIDWIPGGEAVAHERRRIEPTLTPSSELRPVGPWFPLNQGDHATLVNRVEINTGPQEAKAVSEGESRPAIFHIEEGAGCIIIDDTLSGDAGGHRPVQVKSYISSSLTVTFYEKRRNLKKRFLGLGEEDNYE